MGDSWTPVMKRGSGDVYVIGPMSAEVPQVDVVFGLVFNVTARPLRGVQGIGRVLPCVLKVWPSPAWIEPFW